jgi:hypothetical protein
MKKVKSDRLRFRDLDKEHQRLLGRKSTLTKMVDRRMVKLKPLLKKVQELRKELEPIESELELIQKRVREVVDENLYTPRITIVHKVIQKKYPFYYGKIFFGDKSKDKQIPKREEVKIYGELEKRNEELIQKGKSPLYKDIKSKEKEFRNRLRDWVLDWWRDEGILMKK